MKTKNPPKPQPRRQIFVLTPEEKKTIAFVLCGLVLGIGVKHYRDTHPGPPRPVTGTEQRAVKRTTRLHRSTAATSPTPASE